MTFSLRSVAKDSRQYQEETVSLQAAASVFPQAIADFGSDLVQITAEGYPGSRFHSGTKHVDLIENYCIEQAKIVFQARYANVQPLSCSMANVAVMIAVLKPGDKILSLDLKHGGHLSHGSPVSLAAKLFDISFYGLTNEYLDYSLVRAQALKVRPDLIVCGASSYPRAINYGAFRAIADEVGALLLADISHISGLVAGEFVASPIDQAHVTTMSTYKQLYGPRGGLILAGKDFEKEAPRIGKPLHQLLQRGVFPTLQGTPDFRQIAHKALALEEVRTDRFRARMRRVLRHAEILAKSFRDEGVRLVCEGTETHMVMLDLSLERLSGGELEVLLESVGILANRNLIPGDKRSASRTSGLRFGTNTTAYRGVDDSSMLELAKIIGGLIRAPTSVASSRYKEQVKEICRKFPITPNV